MWQSMLSGGGKGRRGHRPWAAQRRGGIWRGENGILKFVHFIAKWHLQCRHCYVYTPLISTSTPRFGTTPPTVSAPRLHTKQCVHQETYTADLTDHSPAVKLYKNTYCPVSVLLAIAIQCFALLTCFQILHQI